MQAKYLRNKPPPINKTMFSSVGLSRAVDISNAIVQRLD